MKVLVNILFYLLLICDQTINVMILKLFRNLTTPSTNIIIYQFRRKV